MPLPSRTAHHQVLPQQYPFSQLEMCTLPLCSQCETIHLEDHASQAQDTKLMRFNEAYVQAINSIEDFLEQQKNNFKKEDAKL